MDEGAPPAAWAAALCAALGAEALGRAGGDIVNAAVERAAEVARLAAAYRDAADAGASVLSVPCAERDAERAAILAEPPMPPPGSPERRRMDARQRRMLAGLVRAADCPVALRRNGPGNRGMPEELT